jgi:multidrug resistance efflux pump
VKRTSLLFSVALLLGFGVAACQVGAQTPAAKSTAARSLNAASHGATDASSNATADGKPSRLSVEAEQFEQEMQRTSRMADELRKQYSNRHSGAEGVDRQSLREKLRPLVEESFEARQRLQLAELKELRRRLAEIEQAVAQREKHKDAIVDLRVDELMNRKPAALAGAPARAPQSRSHQGPQETVPEANSPLPAGSETGVVHYVQEQVEINGEVKAITRPVIEYRRTPSVSVSPYRPPLADSSPEPRGATKDEANSETRRSAEDAFDFKTREQLAQLELESAEAEHAAVGKELDRVRELHKRTAIEESVLGDKEREHRQAEFQLRRATLNVEGLTRQRAELQAAVDAEVAEAEEEVKRAASHLTISEANAAAARGQLKQMEAEAEEAESNLSFCTKVYKRMKDLALEQKAVDMKLVDEKEGKMLAAQAALRTAQAALPAGKARVEQADASIQEARASLHIAELRLNAAQARRDRLKPGDATDAVEAGPSESVPAKPEDKLHG